MIQDRTFAGDGQLFYPGPEWEPEFFGDTAGVVDVLAGAAGALAVRRFAVVVKLQGHAHDVIAGAPEGDRQRATDRRFIIDHEYPQPLIEPHSFALLAVPAAP